eukprot:3260585-Rhodomonas_salina.5
MPVRCPVLMYRMLPCSAAVRGTTDIAYDPIGLRIRCAFCGTDIAYAATRASRPTRYLGTKVRYRPTIMRHGTWC